MQPKGLARTPLQPMPIIATPFERVGINIAGSLPQVSGCHTHIGVIVHYATHYPKAVLLLLLFQCYQGS